MRAPRGILILYGIGAGLGVLAGLSYVVTTALGLPRVSLLRMGMESNVPTWYSASQLLLIAVVLAPLAWRDARLKNPTTWTAALPAALFALLSLDETAMIHERVGWAMERIGAADAAQFDPTWMLLMVPLYAVLALATYAGSRRYLRDRPDVVRLLVVGGALFAVSAVGFEALGAVLGPDAHMARRVLGVLEEVGEMVAATTLLWAALRLIAYEGIELHIGTAPAVLRPDLEQPTPQSPSGPALRRPSRPNETVG